MYLIGWRLVAVRGALMFMALAGVFVVAEGALRVLRWPLNLVPTNYIETVGTTNWPGHSGCYAREGRSCYTINAEGWRDVAHELAKPPGVYRIAVLGDSYVEALQVELEQTFWK